jgi:hypothetical protein
MSLEGELELIQLVKRFGFRYEHRLEQKRITDFFYDMDSGARRQCEDLLRKNRMLPRKKRTKQIDLLVWREGHWAALAIEEKNQNGARKDLNIYKDNIVLTANYDYGSKQIADFGRDLSLQCRGESYLGKAYLAANNLDYEVIPIAVVDYGLKINSMIDTDWAFSRGIFFVNKSCFEWFLNEYDEDRKWIRKVYNRNPKIFYDSAS